MLTKRTFHELLRIEAKPGKDYVQFLERKYDREVERQAALDSKSDAWDAKYTMKKKKAEEVRKEANEERRRKKEEKGKEVGDKAVKMRFEREEMYWQLYDKKRGAGEVVAASKAGHLRGLAAKSKAAHTKSTTAVREHKAADTQYANATIEEIINKLHCFSPTAAHLPLISSPKPPPVPPSFAPHPPKKRPLGRGYLTQGAVHAATKWIAFKQEEELSRR